MHHKAKAPFQVVEFARSKYVPYVFGYHSVSRAIFQEFGILVSWRTVKDWIYETRGYS